MHMRAAQKGNVRTKRCSRRALVRWRGCWGATPRMWWTYVGVVNVVDVGVVAVKGRHGGEGGGIMSS
jgi:hypothetical protein